MSTSRTLSRAAAALSEVTGQSHTRALYALRGAPDAPWPILPVGAKIKFAVRPGVPALFSIAAVSEHGRFVVCIHEGKRGRDYTVIDMALGIRGTSDCGTGFMDEAQIAESMQALLEGERVYDRGLPSRDDEFGPALAAQISYRNWVWLRMAASQPDPRIQAMLPWLAQVMATADARRHNDHHPRSSDELAARLR